MKTLNSFKDIIGSFLVGFQLDENPSELELHKSSICEKIVLKFSEGENISVYTDDLPHFIGEANLTTEFGTDKTQFSGQFNEVVRLVIWKYKPLGININVVKYLVQYELYLSNGRVISIGFFNSNGAENSFLSTGEIFVNPFPLNQEDLSEKVAKRLSCDDFTLSCS